MIKRRGELAFPFSIFLLRNKHGIVQASHPNQQRIATMAKGNSISATKSEDDWQTESDLRTCLEREKIEKDPKRMAKVRALAKSKLMEVAAIASGEES
jgi:hypothetical protein